MYTVKSLLTLAAFAGAAAAQQGPSLPQRPAPQGFQVKDYGTGRLLRSSFQGNAVSATMVARGYVKALTGYFDRMPRLAGGAVDNRDRNVQAMISGTIGGVSALGLMAVTLDNGAGYVSILVDRPQRLGRTLEAVDQGAGTGGKARASRYANVPWTKLRAVDGMSTVSVPQGWTGQGQNGGWEVSGPQGESMTLGISMPYAPLPQGFNLDRATAAKFSPPLDPVRAFQHTYMTYGIPAQVIEYYPAPQVLSGGQSVFLLASLTARGRPYYAWGLSSSAVTSTYSQYWTHYHSAVMAPKEVFAAEFNTMIRIWQSWSISQALINQRMQAAMQAMRETNRIMSQTANDMAESRAKLNHAWSKAFRDETFVQNPQTGEHFTVRPRELRSWIDRLNESEGRTVWREMPTEDYPVR